MEGLCLFSVSSMMLNEKTRGSGRTLKYRRLPLKFRKWFFYCEGDWTMAQAAQKGCGVWIFEEIKRMPSCDSGQLALGIPVWAGGLDQMTSTDPFHHHSFCDSEFSLRCVYFKDWHSNFLCRDRSKWTWDLSSLSCLQAECKTLGKCSLP